MTIIKIKWTSYKRSKIQIFTKTPTSFNLPCCSRAWEGSTTVGWCFRIPASKLLFEYSICLCIHTITPIWLVCIHYGTMGLSIHALWNTVEYRVYLVCAQSTLIALPSCLSVLICHYWKTNKDFGIISKRPPVVPSRELSYPPTTGVLRDDCPFPKVGYVSFLEGMTTTSIAPVPVGRTTLSSPLATSAPWPHGEPFRTWKQKTKGGVKVEGEL